MESRIYSFWVMRTIAVVELNEGLNIEHFRDASKNNISSVLGVK